MSNLNNDDTRKFIGYIVSMQKKTSQDDFFDTLAYGKPDQPVPNQLARDRGATVFKTVEELEAHLASTCRRATESGAIWPKNYRFRITPLYECNQRLD